MVIGFANILVMFSISFLLYKRERMLREYYWPALTAKVMAGIFLGLIYLYYFKEGDTFTYSNDAERLSEFARKDFVRYLRFLWKSDSELPLLDSLNLQQSRAVYFTKIASLFSLLTGSNYWLIASWFSLFSFIMSWELVKELIKYDARLSEAAILSFLFLPSCVFWSSGFIKESLSLGLLCLIVVVFLRVWQRMRLSYSGYIVLIPSIWLLWNLKYYYVAALIPILFTELLYSFTVKKIFIQKTLWVRAAVWCAIFVVPLTLVSFLHPVFNPEIFLQVIVESHDASVQLSNPDDVIRFSNLQPNVLSIVENAPLAFFSGIYRPFVLEVKTLPQFMAATENLLILILSLGFFWGLITGRNKLTGKGGWMIFIFSLILCTILTLSSPNLGTLSRYRIGFLPFLVMLLCYNNVIFEFAMAKVRQIRSRLVR